MAFKDVLSRKNKIEALFQVVLIITVFVFYAFEHRKGRHEFHFEVYNFVFFINYALAALIVNYYLLPRFLYNKKYAAFLALLLVLLTIVIIVEEAVIEKIYFPNTRGASFPGIFINLAGALPTITVLTGVKFAWDALRKEKELKELQLVIKESELQFLKSQINPHFLFNNLNNLYAYALEESSKTPEIILELSAVLRYMLYECQEKYVPFQKEIEHLNNFINLSKLQFEKRGEVQFTTDGIASNYQIAPLILSVFVENAFKHSLSSQTDNILINIDCHLLADGCLNFYCSNSFSEQSNPIDSSQGIGLKNVKKRLDLLYPKAYKLVVNNSGSKYEVSLSLNLCKQ